MDLYSLRLTIWVCDMGKISIQLLLLLFYLWRSGSLTWVNKKKDIVEETPRCMSLTSGSPHTELELRYVRAALQIQWENLALSLCVWVCVSLSLCVCVCPGGHGEQKQALVFCESLPLPAWAHFPHGPGVKCLQAFTKFWFYLSLSPHASLDRRTRPSWFRYCMFLQNQSQWN